MMQAGVAVCPCLPNFALTHSRMDVGDMHPTRGTVIPRHLPHGLCPNLQAAISTVHTWTHTHTHTRTLISYINAPFFANGIQITTPLDCFQRPESGY